MRESIAFVSVRGNKIGMTCRDRRRAVAAVRFLLRSDPQNVVLHAFDGPPPPSGVIHNEDVRTKGQVRLLQLWLTLPKNERWTAPGFQAIHVNSVPVRHEHGAEIRVYSGSSGGFQSGTRNHVAVTMVEINLEPHASAEQDIPALYNGFAFVIDGSVQIGDTVLNTGQVGWCDRPSETGTSVLRIVADESGARLILYAGQPQGDPIVSYGPFIGGSQEDIARLFAEYKAGRFPRLSELAKQHVSNGLLENSRR